MKGTAVNLNFPTRSHSDCLMPVTPRPDQVFVRGQGNWLWDEGGRRYLDWLQGWAVNALGHCPPEVTRALQDQSHRLLTPSPALHNAPAMALAAQLCELSGFDQVVFGSTGAEANEVAIKLARKWGSLNKRGAHEVITFTHGFHGRNLAAMAASGKPGWDTLFLPRMPGFLKAQLNDLDSVRALLSPRTAAVMLEPVQGEAGVYPASRAFLEGLRSLCDEQQTLLIFDEIQTGCGRLGELFAFDYFGVRPDIVTLGKGLGGGVPLSAVLARRHCSVFQHGDHGGTHAGNPLMCAVGASVLQTLARPAFLSQVRERGVQLKLGLQRLSAQFGLGEVRGAGLLLALELGSDRALELVQISQQRGLLINAPRPHCLRFMPALNQSVQDIDLGLALLSDALADLH